MASWGLVPCPLKKGARCPTGTAPTNTPPRALGLGGAAVGNPPSRQCAAALHAPALCAYGGMCTQGIQPLPPSAPGGADANRISRPIDRSSGVLQMGAVQGGPAGAGGHSHSGGTPAVAVLSVNMSQCIDRNSQYTQPPSRPAAALACSDLDSRLPRAESCEPENERPHHARALGPSNNPSPPLPWYSPGQYVTVPPPTKRSAHRRQRAQAGT